MIRIEEIGTLPAQIDVLRLESLAEGFNMVETLQVQWDNQAVRFERSGEMLAAAFSGEDLAGIGGITEDIVDPGWLRMRRFYVRPRFRRSGVGRAMARYLIDRAPSRPIALHTDTASGARFWEALGFSPIDRVKTSHILRP